MNQSTTGIYLSLLKVLRYIDHVYDGVHRLAIETTIFTKAKKHACNTKNAFEKKKKFHLYIKFGQLVVCFIVKIIFEVADMHDIILHAFLLVVYIFYKFTF